jgi:hypothetical protein
MSALWILLAFTNWHDLASGPRVGMPWTNYDYGQALLFETGIQAIPVAGMLVWNFAAAVIGYRWVIRPVFGQQRLAAPVWLLIAGYLPGMLLVVAVSRIVTLALPNTIAPTVLLVTGLAAALFAAYAGLLRQPGQPPPTIDWRRVWPGVAGLLIALIFSVHVDRFHVMGEGSGWFISNVFLSKQHGIGTSGTWPLISQHYDEAAFLYPIVYGLVSPDGTASATLTMLYWLLLACSRLGAVTVTYLAVRALGVDRLSSLIVLAFFCGASLSVNPVVSRLLFDSLSPLAYVLHVSRFLVPVLPLLLIAALTARPILSWQSAGIATLLGIGLSSIPIHVAIVFLWAFAVGAMTLLAPEAARARRVWLAAGVAALTLMAAFSVAYGFQALPAIAKVVVLLAGSVIAAGMMLAAIWLERGSGGDRGDITVAIWLLVGACGGYALGLLLLGNVPIAKTLPLLAEVWPWSNAVIVERVESTLTVTHPTILQSPYCDGGYYWGFRWLTGHCSSLAMFSRTYGLAPLVMTGMLAWWLLRDPTADAPPQRILTPWLVGIMVCFMAMPFGFVIYDFVSPVGSTFEAHNQLSIWLRSRLIEPWFYGGGLLALALFLRMAATSERRLAQALMMIAVALFALSPLALPAQLVANIGFLLDAARGH